MAARDTNGAGTPLNSNQKRVVEMVRSCLELYAADIGDETELLAYIKQSVPCLTPFTRKMTMEELERCALELGQRPSGGPTPGQPPTPPPSTMPTSDTALDAENNTSLTFRIAHQGDQIEDRPIVIGSFILGYDNYITENTVANWGFSRHRNGKVELEWEEMNADSPAAGRRGTALFSVVQSINNGGNIALGTAAQTHGDSSQANTRAGVQELDLEPSQELENMTIHIVGMMNASSAIVIARNRLSRSAPN